MSGEIEVLPKASSVEERGRGRPPLLEERHIAAVSMLVRAGSFPYVAAEACGIDRRTFYRYMRDDYMSDDALFVRFREAVRQAQAEARAEAEIIVKRDKPEVWLLKGPGRERADAPGWASEGRVEVSGKGGGPVQVQGEHVVEHVDGGAPRPVRPDLSKLTDRELDEFRRMLRKMLPAEEQEIEP